MAPPRANGKNGAANADKDKIPISSVQELQEELKAFRAALSIKETEHTWEGIDRAVKRYTAVTRGGGCRYEAEYIAGFKDRELAHAIIGCLATERTQLSASALLLVSAATRLGPSFASLLQLYLPHILRLLSRTNKLYISRATACVLAIVRNTRSATVLPYLREGMDEKANSHRKGCMQGILCALGAEDGFELESGTLVDKEVLRRRYLDDVEKCIKIAARDRDIEVRKLGKKAWGVYRREFEERVPGFAAPLTPTIRKYLDLPPPGQPIPTSSLSASQSGHRAAPPPAHMAKQATQVHHVPRPAPQAGGTRGPAPAQAAPALRANPGGFSRPASRGEAQTAPAAPPAAFSRSVGASAGATSAQGPAYHGSAYQASAVQQHAPVPLQEVRRPPGRQGVPAPALSRSLSSSHNGHQSQRYALEVAAGLHAQSGEPQMQRPAMSQTLSQSQVLFRPGSGFPPHTRHVSASSILSTSSVPVVEAPPASSTAQPAMHAPELQPASAQPSRPVISRPPSREQMSVPSRSGGQAVPPAPEPVRQYSGPLAKRHGPGHHGGKERTGGPILARAGRAPLPSPLPDASEAEPTQPASAVPATNATEMVSSVAEAPLSDDVNPLKRSASVLSTASVASYAHAPSRVQSPDTLARADPQHAHPSDTAATLALSPLNEPQTDAAPVADNLPPASEPAQESVPAASGTQTSPQEALPDPAVSTDQAARASPPSVDSAAAPTSAAFAPQGMPSPAIDFAALAASLSPPSLSKPAFRPARPAGGAGVPPVQSYGSASVRRVPSASALSHANASATQQAGTTMGQGPPRINEVRPAASANDRQPSQAAAQPVRKPYVPQTASGRAPPPNKRQALSSSTSSSSAVRPAAPAAHQRSTSSTFNTSTKATGTSSASVPAAAATNRPTPLVRSRPPPFKPTSAPPSKTRMVSSSAAAGGSIFSRLSAPTAASAARARAVSAETKASSAATTGAAARQKKSAAAAAAAASVASATSARYQAETFKRPAAPSVPRGEQVPAGTGNSAAPAASGSQATGVTSAALDSGPVSNAGSAAEAAQLQPVTLAGEAAQEKADSASGRTHSAEPADGPMKIPDATKSVTYDGQLADAIGDVTLEKGTMEPIAQLAPTQPVPLTPPASISAPSPAKVGGALNVVSDIQAPAVAASPGGQHALDTASQGGQTESRAIAFPAGKDSEVQQPVAAELQPPGNSPESVAPGGTDAHPADAGSAESPDAEEEEPAAERTFVVRSDGHASQEDNVAPEHGLLEQEVTTEELPTPQDAGDALPSSSSIRPQSPPVEAVTTDRTSSTEGQNILSADVDASTLLENADLAVHAIPEATSANTRASSSTTPASSPSRQALPSDVDLAAPTPRPASIFANQRGPASSSRVTPKQGVSPSPPSASSSILFSPSKHLGELDGALLLEQEPSHAEGADDETVILATGNNDDVAQREGSQEEEEDDVALLISRELSDDSLEELASRFEESRIQLASSHSDDEDHDGLDGVDSTPMRPRLLTSLRGDGPESDGDEGDTTTVAGLEEDILTMSLKSAPRTLRRAVPAQTPASDSLRKTSVVDSDAAGRRTL